MTRRFFGYNWLMNFGTVDFNRILDFVDEHDLELRRTHIGNKYLRFCLAVDDELQMKQLVSMLVDDISKADWQPINIVDFETATPIEHNQEKRSETLSVFNLIQMHTYETNDFYRQVYNSDTDNKIYRAKWEINKQGLDENVIEQAFDVVTKYENIWMAREWQYPASFISIYVVIGEDASLTELLSALPTQLSNAMWDTITSDQVPDMIAGHPYNVDSNIRVAWREGLYEWLRKSDK